MATQLGLYNAALRHLGERKLSSLSEATEPRRALDDVWNDGFVDYILHQGYWKCAQRVAKIPYSTDVTVEFGYPKAYPKPSDIVKLHKISPDEFFNVPLTEYSEEAGFWYGHNSEVYVSYISNDETRGGDLTAWPPAMTTYAGFYLATLVQERLAPAVATEALHAKMKLALDDALAKDAMEGPTEFPPASSWVTARGKGRSYDDRGNRGSLIG